MRLTAMSLAAVILLSHSGYWSCDCDDDDGDDFEDVSVDITGAAGLDFDASFEDDEHTQFVSGNVPFSASFSDQENFFRAEVDKNSSGSESICVEISTRHDSVRECTTNPDAHLTVTLSF